METLPEPLVFEWDEGNIEKNVIKHGVTNKETAAVYDLGNYEAREKTDRNFYDPSRPRARHICSRYE